jgi:glyoxylase-like metal-dependent hydrolase (beta-lactamase superfamily II)
MTVTDETEVPQPPEMIVGVARALSPLVRRILAPNPGIMTGPGTNTYLVGIDEIAVIDPGPDDAEHLDAVAGCGGDRIRWIVLTHSHLDHSPGAAGLKERTGAEVLAFEPPADAGLVVDTVIGDGFQIEATEFRLTALHTPGHASNHLCYKLEEEHALFTGDHVMSGSTVVIRPPDGDMATYIASLERVRAMRLKKILPGHGHIIEDPYEVLDFYLAHRAEREAAILEALKVAGTTDIDGLVETVYVDVDEERHPIARHTVHAHLRKLADEGLVTGTDLDDLDAKWTAG